MIIWLFHTDLNLYLIQMKAVMLPAIQNCLDALLSGKV